jgi:hypothetical protein
MRRELAGGMGVASRALVGHRTSFVELHSGARAGWQVVYASRRVWELELEVAAEVAACVERSRDLTFENSQRHERQGRQGAKCAVHVLRALGGDAFEVGRRWALVLSKRNLRCWLGEGRWALPPNK